MERGAVRAMAARLGLAEPALLRKAEEYLRLSQVKCTGLMAQMTATSSAVMCLDLAASFMKQPVDKSYCVKLSGLNKTTYQSSMKSLECLLGLNQRLGMRDLAVQFCCSEAVTMASEILQRYKCSLSEAQRADLDFSKPLFVTAALCTACSCSAQTHRGLSQQVRGAAPTALDRTGTAPSCCLSICSLPAVPSSMLPVMASHGLSCFLTGSEEDEELPCKQPKTETNQDYEEWKKKILENAAKAQETRS
ncbi:ORC6 protein, partial [Passerina amoena]|nr:ORC6 protein [Passerina amoena]